MKSPIWGPRETIQSSSLGGWNPVCGALCSEWHVRVQSTTLKMGSPTVSSSQTQSFIGESEEAMLTSPFTEYFSCLHSGVKWMWHWLTNASLWKGIFSHCILIGLIFSQQEQTDWRQEYFRGHVPPSFTIARPHGSENVSVQRLTIKLKYQHIPFSFQERH